MILGVLFLYFNVQRTNAMKETIKIKLVHESPALNVSPLLKKTDLKKTVIQSLKVSKNRTYNVEVLNEKGEVVLKFKHAD